MTQVTNEMVAAAWAKWKPRHKGRLGPGPAFVEALQAAIDVMPSRSFSVGILGGPGEVTGPVYVNHIPYVPASEVERLRAALQFYADPANWIDAEWDDGSTDGCSTPNAIPAVNQDGAWVCDCGDIARAALGQEPTT